MVTTHRSGSFGALLRRLAVGAVAAVALALPGAAAAAPGDLDPTFGPSQPVIADLGQRDHSGTAVVQPDGKTLVLVVQEPLVPGLPTTSIARFHANGSLDTDFGTGGLAAVPGAGLGATGIGLHGDGFVVSASSILPGSVPSLVLRFDSSGELDENFGDAGVAEVDAFPGSHETALGVTAAADGKIVLAVAAQSPALGAKVVRLQPNGDPDGSYGTGGMSAVELVDNAYLSDIALAPDGSVVVAGRVEEGPGSEADLTLSRVLPDGSPDEEFLASAHDAGGHELSGDVVLDPQGRIVVAGITYASGASTALLARFLPDGSPDASFGNDGFALVDAPTYDFGIPSGALVRVGSVAVQPGGRIVTAVHDFDGVDVAAVRPSGTPDPSFGGGDGLVKIPFAGGQQLPPSVALAPGERVMVSMTASGESDEDVALARLLADEPTPPGNPSPPKRDETPDPRPTDVAKPVKGGVVARWSVRGGRASVKRLLVRGLPASARVQVRCRGKRCPFKVKRARRPKNGRVNVRRILGAQFTLRAGQTLEIRIAAPGKIGKIVRYKFRKGRKPAASTLCLPVGGGKPQRC